MTTIPADVARSDELRATLAKALREADANFGYSFNLTRLVDGEETHTLRMDGFEPADFADREDGYRLIEERRSQARADAILSALTPPPAAGPDREAVDRMIRAMPHFANRDWEADPIQQGERDWMEPLARAALEPRGDVRREAMEEAARIADGIAEQERELAVANSTDHAVWKKHGHARNRIAELAAAIRAAAGEPRPVTQTPEREHGAGDVLSRYQCLVDAVDQWSDDPSADAEQAILDARNALPDAPGTEGV